MREAWRPGLQGSFTLNGMDVEPGVVAGRAWPLGAHVVDGGTNFSVWSRTAARVDLLLFNDVDDAQPSWIVPLDRARNRTSFWHVFVPGVGPGHVYAWHVDGTFDPSAGLRHDPSALWLDPYGVAVAVPSGYDRMAGARPGRDPRTAMKSVVADLSASDWETG